MCIRDSIKTILAITTLYITFGVAGYLSYGQCRERYFHQTCYKLNMGWERIVTWWRSFAGPETNEIITLNLPSDDGFNFAILVKICLCFRCSVHFIHCFPILNVFKPQRRVCNKKFNIECFITQKKSQLKVVFLSSLFFTYPIMLFPVTSILEKKLEVQNGWILSLYIAQSDNDHNSWYI